MHTSAALHWHAGVISMAEAMGSIQQGDLGRENVDWSLVHAQDLPLWALCRSVQK